jgi:hypothetical protein
MSASAATRSPVVRVVMMSSDVHSTGPYVTTQPNRGNDVNGLCSICDIFCSFPKQSSGNHYSIPEYDDVVGNSFPLVYTAPSDALRSGVSFWRTLAARFHPDSTTVAADESVVHDTNALTASP